MSDCPHDTRDERPIPGDVQNQRQPQEPDRETLLDKLADLMAGAEDDSDVDQIEALLDKLRESDDEDERVPDIDLKQSLAELYKRYDASAPHASAPQVIAPRPAAWRPRRSKMFRYLAGVAVIASLLLVNVVITGAGGWDILKTVARISEETFHIEWPGRTPPQGPDVPDPEIEYESLQVALDAYSIEEQMAPTKYPDNAILQKLFVDESTGNLTFVAKFDLPDGALSITIRQGVVIPSSEVEKNTEDVEYYTVAGIEHQIMQDIDRYKAVWDNGPWECKINGDVSRDEIVAMIDSIYK